MARALARWVRQLPSGKWNLNIRLKGHGTVSETFATRELAEAASLKFQQKLADGTVAEEAKDHEVLTLKEAVEKYLKYVSPTKKGSRQEISRGNHLLELPYLADMLSTRLHKLSDDQVAQFKTQRLQEVGNNSVRLEMALLSVVWNHARKEWRLPALKLLINPVSLVSKPKPGKGRKRRLEEDEAPYLFDALTKARNPEALAVIVMAVESAMRKGENLDITWDRIDLEHGTIMLYDTKNNEDRAVPLSQRAIDLLKSLPKKDNRVFHYKKSGIYTAWYAALKRARAAYLADCKRNHEEPREGFLQNIRIHDLRHEATSRLFEEYDLNLMEASSVTGHKSPAMLQRYTHVNARKLSRKMRGLDKKKTETPDDDVITKLERLGALLEKELLTPEEFKEQKARLLGQ